MKIIASSIILLLMVTFISCKPSLDNEIPVQVPLAITPFQQYMVDEINFARNNPAGYAELRLKSVMDESSDNGSYLYMKNLVACSALTFNHTLNLSASNYALFLAEKNLMGHDLNGTPLKRAITLGFQGSSIGENIAASTGDLYDSTLDPKCAAIHFVQIMIIDNGVADLSHRLTMLNAKYSTIGIGYSKNPSSTFVNYNVQDYGGL